MTTESIPVSVQDQKFSGLSSDIKPTEGVSAKATFKETDTGDEYEYSGSSWSQISTSGVANTHPLQSAGERGPGELNQYAVGVDECNITRVAAGSADTAISGGFPALCFGVIMETSQTGNIAVKDGATSILAVTPGANTFLDLKGAKFNTSLVVSTAASAACVVLWRLQ